MISGFRIGVCFSDFPQIYPPYGTNLLKIMLHIQATPLNTTVHDIGQLGGSYTRGNEEKEDNQVKAHNHCSQW